MGLCGMNGNGALYSLWPFLPHAAKTMRGRLVQKRPNAKGIPSGKGHKESELAWMGLVRIGTTSSGHPALRQRILWGLG